PARRVRARVRPHPKTRPLTRVRARNGCRRRSGIQRETGAGDVNQDATIAYAKPHDADSDATRPLPPGQPLLEVRDLRTHFPIRKGVLARTVGHVKAVDGVSFDIAPGKTLGLVGESGCGKTTVGRTILRLIPVTSGSVKYRGQN